jgi:hypothetical protein
MPLDTPFVLGPFRVDPDGRLTPLRPDAAPGFSVRWRGRALHARLRAAGGELTIGATLGRVPSSSGGASAQRAGSFRLLRALSASLPDGWRVSLRADHRVALEATASLGAPTTAVQLLTAVARFVLELDPYLDLIDEAGMPGGIPGAA